MSDTRIPDGAQRIPIRADETPVKVEVVNVATSRAKGHGDADISSGPARRGLQLSTINVANLDELGGQSLGGRVALTSALITLAAVGAAERMPGWLHGYGYLPATGAIGNPPLRDSDHVWKPLPLDLSHLFHPYLYNSIADLNTGSVARAESAPIANSVARARIAAEAGSEKRVSWADYGVQKPAVKISGPGGGVYLSIDALDTLRGDRDPRLTAIIDRVRKDGFEVRYNAPPSQIAFT